MNLSIRVPDKSELHDLASYAPDTEHAVDVNRPDGNRGVYLAAWDAGVPAGHLFLRWQSTEVPRIVDQHPTVAGLAQAPGICNIFVLPERRSEGIGSQLIAAALQTCRQRQSAHLTICVNTDNPRAHALYERLGFTDPGVGVFTTSGVYTDDKGKQHTWQNGPQWLLAQSLT